MENPVKKGSNISRTERFFGVQPAPEYLVDPQKYETVMKGIADQAAKKKIRHNEIDKSRLPGG
jgi:hypothetical protein